ncbi:SDR family NAD(P)-dependent oxidoreductase [Mesorhizobium sp.]|uniref:SDR family NAD(P)-dependent oxidoreductase n=1 Tax=Mesorhizobium sp. TaxID=1871066 RepID=UPI0025D4C707|nr:SDR family NAD(P)-dependent oxidoreductase [Mesorhizobium sp.]
MARVFVSGSSAGLGLLAGKELLAKGHGVIFHARNAVRAEDLKHEAANASSIVVGDISTISGAVDVADQVNALGPIDAVIHNAGVGYGGSLRSTSDGIPDIFAVNVLAAPRRPAKKISPAICERCRAIDAAPPSL